MRQNPTSINTILSIQKEESLFLGSFAINKEKDDT